MNRHSRIYAKINLNAVRSNFREIERKTAAQSGIIAVIKADGYGHGAVPIAKTLEGEARLFGFAVATGEEAVSLRQSGIAKPILILGYAFEEDYETLLKEDVRLTVYSFEAAKKISDTAKRLSVTAKIHIKIDTGMSRIGYQANEASVQEILKIKTLPCIEIEGIFTHFARADEADKSSAKLQLKRFLELTGRLEEENLTIPYRHCSNSAGILELPEANLNLVRAGIILYGLWPSDEVKKDSALLTPAMELKSHIIHMKTLEAGREVSYGGTYRLEEPRIIATVPVGYGDGYPRSLSNKGHVLIHGKKAPIVGRVCMDQFMVDVTDIEGVSLFDTVTLLGEDNGSFLRMEELSKLSGRFNYEFACCIGKRVPRIFSDKKIE